MEISKYEAAALYNCRDRKAPLQCLVLDLEDCSWGICRPDSRGRVELTASQSSMGTDLWQMCIRAAAKEDSQEVLAQVQQQMEGTLSQANDALHHYLVADREMDLPLFSFPDGRISCREFEERLGPVKEKLEELMDSVMGVADSRELETMEIILLGRAQELFLVTYYIRERFCGDPLLPDERFRNEEFEDPYTEIVRLGRELSASVRVFEHSLSVLVYDRDSDSYDRILTVEQGTEKKDSGQLDYKGPIFMSREDKLQVQIDDRTIEIGIPYSFLPLDSDLVEVALGGQKDRDELAIRRCRFPGRVHMVELK